MAIKSTACNLSPFQSINKLWYDQVYVYGIICVGDMCIQTAKECWKTSIGTPLKFLQQADNEHKQTNKQTNIQTHIQTENHM